MALPYIVKELSQGIESEPQEHTSNVINLPSTVNTFSDGTNGQVSVSVKGVTRTNLVPTNIEEWKQGSVDATGVFFTDGSFIRTDLIPFMGSKTYTFSVEVGHRVRWVAEFDNNQIFLIRTGDIDSQNRVIKLNDNTRYVSIVVGKLVDGVTAPTIPSDVIMSKPLAEERADGVRGTFISYGTKSTISASRLKSVGKNLFDGELESGTISNLAGEDTPQTNGIRGIGFIKIQPNTTYTLSNSHGYSMAVHYYDYNKNFIQADNISNNSTYTTPSKADYCRIRTGTGSPQNDLSSLFQLEKGEIATPYEPYAESTQYLPNVGELRSVPSAKDEVRVSEGKLIIRNKKYIVQTNDITLWAGSLTFTNVTHAVIGKPSDSKMLGNITSGGSATLEGYKEISGAGDNIDDIGGFTVVSANSYVYIGLAKGTTLAQAQALLTGLALTYQLSEPVITDLDIPYQPLTAYPSGTIYVDPIVKEKPQLYNNGLFITDTNVPIESVDSIQLIEDDIVTEVDLSKVNINVEGITITDATHGQKYILIYKYPSELTTIPTLSFSYKQNIRAVKDGVLEGQAIQQQEINNINSSMVALNEKATNMSSVDLITDEMTDLDLELKNKINEIVLAWR